MKFVTTRRIIVVHWRVEDQFFGFWGSSDQFESDGLSFLRSCPVTEGSEIFFSFFEEWKTSLCEGWGETSSALVSCTSQGGAAHGVS